MSTRRGELTEKIQLLRVSIRCRNRLDAHDDVESLLQRLDGFVPNRSRRYEANGVEFLVCRVVSLRVEQRRDASERAGQVRICRDERDESVHLGCSGAFAPSARIAKTGEID